MELKRSKQRQKQKQRDARKKRSLHDKHKRRRKKDMMIGIPFLVAYNGDPAMGNYLFCDQVRSYKLINYGWNKPFARLHKYLMKPIKSMFLVANKILVKEAPSFSGAYKKVLDKIFDFLEKLII